MKKGRELRGLHGTAIGEQREAADAVESVIGKVTLGAGSQNCPNHRFLSEFNLVSPRRNIPEILVG